MQIYAIKNGSERIWTWQRTHILCSFYEVLSPTGSTQTGYNRIRCGLRDLTVYLSHYTSAVTFIHLCSVKTCETCRTEKNVVTYHYTTFVHDFCDVLSLLNIEFEGKFGEQKFLRPPRVPANMKGPVWYGSTPLLQYIF